MDAKNRTVVVPDGAKAAVISRFCEKLAHDFNNIFGAIEGYASLAGAGLDPASQARADIEDVRASVQRAAEMTEKLSVFAGRKAMERYEFDADSLLKQAAGAASGPLWGDIKVIVVNKDLSRLVADFSLLSRALSALLENARLACRQGGEVTLGAEKVSLAPGREGGAAAAAGGEFARFYVRDTGEGVKEADMERLFEPFFSTRRAHGLGLALVYGVARLHRGWAEASVAPGEGSEFSIYLSLGPDLKKI